MFMCKFTFLFFISIYYFVNILYLGPKLLKNMVEVKEFCLTVANALLFRRRRLLFQKRKAIYLHNFISVALGLLQYHATHFC